MSNKKGFWEVCEGIWDSELTVKKERGFLAGKSDGRLTKSWCCEVNSFKSGENFLSEFLVGGDVNY
jgi:hypothetical protein